MANKRKSVGWFSSLGLGQRKKEKPTMDPDWPDWYLTYYHNYTAWEEDTEYQQLELLVFDTETTGLDPNQDRILSIGAIPMANNRLRPNQFFSRYLNPQVDATHHQSVVIHGLLPNAQGRTYHEEAIAIADFLAYCGRRVLVGHHLAFDRAMIDRALKRHGAGSLLNQGIDTVQVAKRLSPSGYWSPANAYALEVLARRYQIELSDRHTAIGDSYITAILLLKLCGRLSERKGRSLQLDDLL